MRVFVLGGTSDQGRPLDSARKSAVGVRIGMKLSALAVLVRLLGVRPRKSQIRSGHAIPIDALRRRVYLVGCAPYADASSFAGARQIPASARSSSPAKAFSISLR